MNTAAEQAVIDKSVNRPLTIHEDVPPSEESIATPYARKAGQRNSGSGVGASTSHRSRPTTKATSKF